MSLLTKTFTFSNGATIYASEHNTNFDILYSGVNGNLDNANIKALAGIVDTKLATISTANKVGGSSFSGLASTPSNAGVIPIANGSLGKNFASTTSGRVLYFSGTGTITDSAVGTSGQLLTSSGSHVYWSTLSVGDMSYSDARFATGTFVVSNASGVQDIAGVGFTPKFVSFNAYDSVANVSASIGEDNGTKRSNMYWYVSKWKGNNADSIYIDNAGDGTNVLRASISTMSADGFSISITRVGSGYAVIANYTAYR